MRNLLAFLLAVSGSAQAAINVNSGLSGNWFNPETPGQGMIIDVIPSRGELVIGWYTFEAGNALAIGAVGQRWLTAEGRYSGDRAQLTIFNTTGGEFNTARPAVTLAAGAATIVFENCEQAIFRFSLDGGVNGEFPLVRLSPDSHCQTAVNSAALPSYFHLDAEASGVDESGNFTECHVNLVYELEAVTELPGVVEFRGVGGGEVSRAVQDSTGAGFAFFADFFVPDAEGLLLSDGRLEFDGPGKGVDDSRLYLNLARFVGTLEADGTASGEWTCGPFDVDVGGYTDIRQTARGIWHLTPIEDPLTSSEPWRSSPGSSGAAHSGSH